MQELDFLKAELLRLKSLKRSVQNKAESYKVSSNGAFGKLGSPYSILYSPKMMIQVTVNGQLAILMLIESLELAGFRVISANTDGIVTKVPHARRDEFFDIIMEWEGKTGFNTEETTYKSLHSRDVNTYVAFPFSGPHKGKGGFGPSGPGHKGAMGMKKNPDIDISFEAATAFLKDGTDIEETIFACKSFRKFVTVTRVNGGAEKDGQYIGKAIRFYYAKGVTGSFQRCDSGNTVPSTDGAKLCMTMEDDVAPDDIDHARYVREAFAILQDVGIATLDPTLADRKGVMVARPPDQKTYHIVKLPSGHAACGKALGSIRDSWVEVSDVPIGERLCKACIKAAALLPKEWEDDL